MEFFRRARKSTTHRETMQRVNINDDVADRALLVSRLNESTRRALADARQGLNTSHPLVADGARKVHQISQMARAQPQTSVQYTRSHRPPSQSTRLNPIGLS